MRSSCASRATKIVNGRETKVNSTEQLQYTLTGW